MTEARQTEDSTDWSDLSNLTLLDEIRIGIWSHGIGEHIVVPLGRPATVQDLHLTKLKAEIVDGQLIVIGPTVFGSAEAAWKIRESLHRHQKTVGGGYAYGSKLAFVDLPNRLSFCPDVSWYVEDPKVSYFPAGAPVFAVEIRDPPEYGDEAERRMAAKRADYFAAGTQVVWDVDVLREGWVHAYHTGDPENPIVFSRGDVADVEPAVPGWRFAVDELFR
ncbi:MAG TPA: Uma2 family endonuclease [Longimicrobium sp.]|nr:Uma2 family endonuclease [Longimicrobium sp.]